MEAAYRTSEKNRNIILYQPSLAYWTRDVRVKGVLTPTRLETSLSSAVAYLYLDAECSGC